LPTPNLPTPRRRLTAVGAAALVVVALTFGLVGRVDAAPTTQSNAAASYLAGLVGPDGSVEDPNSGLPSVSGTVQVALALLADQSQTDALARAVGYIGTNVDGYITISGVDNPGRIGYLVMLAEATGADPSAFGTSSVDLLARLDGTLGAAEPGLYGPADIYSAAFNQSIALLALATVGQPVPAEALNWLLDQQCDAGNNSEGGWQPYRADSGGTLAPCDPSDSAAYTGADSNSTAVAIQALAAIGNDSPIPAALGFLALTQSSSGTAAGGFGFYAGADADPNSTALGIQALVAAGQDASVPFASLATWQIASGDEAGALSSPYSSGFADFLATTQGVWGLALQALPFPQLPTPPPPTSSTTSTTTGGSGGTGGTGGATVTPAFTG
jgi:hypothetical protein